MNRINCTWSLHKVVGGPSRIAPCALAYRRASHNPKLVMSKPLTSAFSSPADKSLPSSRGRDESTDRSGSKRVKTETVHEEHHASASLSALKSYVENSKTFNDPVHGLIDMCNLCLKIIDSPEFQRLQGMKQLGVCDRVYRGATHTRFEHSMGVAHLAERLAESIQRKQPLLEITKSDVLCVKIAGLCHDLGHGPYSHLYDGVFIKRMHPNGVHGDGKKWRHEDGSVKMFRHLLRVNKIDLTKYGLTNIDQVFIEEIIGGVEGANRRGRGPNKFFLYDIVNNTKSGLDVDKLDYYMRDAMMTNVSIQLDPERFIHCVLVMPADPIEGSAYHLSDQNDSGSVGGNSRRVGQQAPELMMCYPEKLVSEAVTIFRTRYDLHHLVYQHKAVKAIEYMVSGVVVRSGKS